jgi:hypothetical protein
MPLATPTDPDATLHTNTQAALLDVRACTEQFSRTLAIAHSLVAAEQPVDLAGLDREMGFICARALDLPPEQGRGVRSDLIGLRLELDALSSALAARAPPDD